MMALLVLKSKLKNLYERHYGVVRGIIKICLMFSVLFLLKSQMNFSGLWGHHLFILGLAMLCGVTPDIICLLTIVAVTTGELYQLAPILALAFLLLLIIYYLLFGRLTEKQGIILASIPILSVIQLEYLIPIVAGLFFTPVMIPAFIMGVIFRFLFMGVQEYASAISRVTEDVSPIAALQYLMGYLRGNSFFMIMMITFIVTFVSVYLIRRAKIQYASQIAILVGAILSLVFMLLGNVIWELDTNLWNLIVSIFVSVFLAYVIQFFHMSLDYKGTRKLQFEDDEYYYYVTAIPKLKVAVVDKTVTRIVGEEEENIDLKAELEKAAEEDENEMI